MEEELLMEILSLAFTAMELAYAALFINRAWRAVEVSKAGRELYPETSDKLRYRAILGGALGIIHLYIAFILIRPYLGFLPDTRWVLLVVWPVNSAISLWAFWKTR